jgi:polyisoprenyl-teichoic acid--peptidoglycan teichoic acid transferase
LGVTKVSLFIQKTGITPSLGYQLIANDGITLQSSHNRTNVLLLGIGGGTHEGADLTDTIIVLSLDNVKHSTALISIPRDTWSDTLKDKVNSAYHYGELKQKGGGMILAKVVAEDVIGMPIQYGLLIDFSGFKNMIDLLGGIDVAVSKTFTDNEYPIPGKEQDTCPEDPTNRCVYKTIHFEAGIQHMSGERALEYVRSRHAEGEEGSDFARSRRQQDILIALKDTIMNPTRWMTFHRLSVLPKAIDDAADTDMNIGVLLSVGKRFLKTKQSDIKRIAFDTQLVEPDPYAYKGLFVLIPKEDWETVHSYIAGQLIVPTPEELR